MKVSARRRQRQERFLAVDLYPVTGEPWSAGRTDEQVLAGFVAGGARIVQLRDKVADTATLYRKALVFRQVTAAAGMLLIVNDRVDVALAVGADGVHLGQTDLPLAAARRLLPDLLIGVSTHGLDEALAAQAGGADYVNLGPIFPTQTKAGASPSLGPDAIRAIAPHLRLPFTVMGGIKADNLDQVLATGAKRVAVVTALTMAADVAGTVRAWRQRLRAAQAQSRAG